MIIKFKLFEEINKLPEIGDYVIVDGYEAGYAEKGIHFFNTHIGKIVNISNINKVCQIEFEEKFEDESALFCGTDKLIYYSKNKKDVELYLASMKYNL